MKYAFCAFALLAPVLTSASVKLDVKVKYNNEKMKESFILSNHDNIHVIAHQESSITTEFALQKETPKKASIMITIKKGDQVLQNAVITTAYNKKATLVCPSERINASISCLVSQLSMTTTE